MSSHDEWDEIAAGHALGALEPDDEQRFVAHLATCDLCPAVLAETDAVMAALALGTEQVAPPPELKTRLMAAIHDASDGPPMAMVSSPDTLEVIRSRRRLSRETLATQWVRLAAAASVILLAVIAAGVWSLNGSSSPTTPRFVSLQQSDKADVATVELLGDQAWMIATAMPANNSSDSVYVLWAVPAKGAPVAVGKFDVEAGHPVVQVGEVRNTLASVSAFAVSKEPGRTVPSKPSDVIATGAVPWPVTQAFRTFD
jgi:anti-sigma-K factor RskA